MMSQERLWCVAKPMPPEVRHRLIQRSGLHPLIAQILYNRGITVQAEIDAFLNGSTRFCDPSLMLDLPLAVARIRRALSDGEQIVVYGDFDADGVTATALLVQILSAFGASVEPYIPHRVDEGYGLNCAALGRIAERGARLVITVDCGIRSPAEAEYARGLGLDLIISDHHSIARDPEGHDQLPSALAVLNPRRQGDHYPFKGLAGVGLAFKLAQALLLADRDEPLSTSPVVLVEEDLLDLVALGTVADLAPLLDENRMLVQRGLAELRKARRPGIQALFDEARLHPERVDASAIAFILAPRLNAAGRLHTAQLSYDLLMAPDVLRARELATQLGELNRQRQELTQQKVTLAQERLVQGGARDLYLLADPGFPPGIVGLVAGRLAEDLYRPVLVAELGAEEAHGSARSIPEFNVTAALDRCRDLLIRHGGHAAAAGFTIRKELLPDLQTRLEAIAAQELAGLDLRPSFDVDAEISLGDLDWAVQALLAKLEPCGNGNPQPVLVSRNLEVISARPLGSENQHLKLVVRDPSAVGMAARVSWDAIAFRMGSLAGQFLRQVDLAYSLEVNNYGGNPRLQLVVKDLHRSEPAPVDLAARSANTANRRPRSSVVR